MSALMPTYKRLPVAFSHGEGARLYDLNGREYLDGLSGIAVTNLGHSHPAVTAAICEQASTLAHTSNLFVIPQQECLAAELTAITGMERVFFCNSGAEANEAVIKLARHYGHDRGINNPTIVVLEQAFHGRTMGALAATAGTGMQTPFAPMLGGFVRVASNDLAAIKALTQTHSNIVAVMLEPVQGEGGVRPLDLDYLTGLRQLCDEQQWLLMFDEVQTGNGRCGDFYAFMRLGVVPDVLSTAKGLGNGFPIGACMARGDAAAVMTPGDHGTTYGGNPIACSAASAVFNTLSRQSLCSRADPIRSAILDRFHTTLNDPSTVREVRGLGLMIGIEVTIPATEIVATALTLGAIVNVTAGNTIRLLPPLIMSDDEASELGHIVAQVVNTLSERPS